MPENKLPTVSIATDLLPVTGIGYNASMSNHFTYSVPFTEEELYHDYTVLRLTQVEIAIRYGTTQKVIWRAMKKMGIVSRRAAKREQRREANSNWRGGRVLQATKKRQRGERTSFGNGYYYILMPEHPNAGSGGYVAEHVFVLTQHLGRSLAKGEMVHHINLNKHDNRLENLALTSAREHAVWHLQLEELAVTFMAEGRIAFDPTRGYYLVG
jgi:hypothetical protein